MGGAGARGSYAGGLPTLRSRRSHCRRRPRTTEGSPSYNGCSPSIQCRAPGCPCPCTVQGGEEKGRAVGTDPDSQAGASAGDLSAAAAVEVQMVAVALEEEVTAAGAMGAEAARTRATAAGSHSAQSICTEFLQCLHVDRWACRDTRSGRRQGSCYSPCTRPTPRRVA
jgi:hypothetical protein